MNSFFRNLRKTVLGGVSLLVLNGALYAEETKDLFEMSLEELMNVDVTSASNTGEKLSKAPATIIVITEQDIQERGYTEFYDILNDLPGFDMSRAFGDEEYYIYARGYRKTISDQMLFMVDGMVMNLLYSNNMSAYSQYPMNNIKQVEVVYGPASAIYGPNAFAGVINIITKKQDKSTVSTSTGANNTNIVDLNLIGNAANINYNFTGRILSSDGYDFADRNPSIQSKLYTDKTKWGPFINTEFAGYGSKRYDSYMQGEINYKELTLGVLSWFHESGYGSEFAGTKALNKAVWQFNDLTMYAKYDKELTKALSSKSTFKYRSGGSPETSSFIERYSGGVDFSYWSQLSSSISLFQDFSLKASDEVFVNFGLKYERKNLQKGFDISYGSFAKEDSVFVYPLGGLKTPNQVLDQNNHYISEDKGIYAQVKYSPSKILDVVAGLRYDYNNIYKEIISPRIGVIYEPISGLVTKAFFGTAFLEPTARSLYGGWSGGLSNTKLNPEKMQTLEFSVAYTSGNYSNGVDFYFNNGKDAIGKVNNKTVNIGERKMLGFELYSKAMFTDVASWLTKFKADVFLSYIKSEEDLTNSGSFAESGNMAPIKLKAILTGYFTKDLSLSLQVRYTDKINTVVSNPLKQIDSWFTADLYIAQRNLFTEGLTLGIKVYNVFDTKYNHPGYQDASAGIAVDSQGNYIDDPKGGWYTSLLPQPGREVRAILKLEL